MRPLGQTTLKVLAILTEFQSKGLPPPTIRELCNMVFISSTSVMNYHLNRLVDRGLIERHPNKARAVHVIATSIPKPGIVCIPIIGVLRADQRIPERS